MTACDEMTPCQGDEVCHNGICVSQNCLLDDKICSNHGECINDGCECYRPYGGYFCEKCRNETYEKVGEVCRRKCDADSDCSVTEKCDSGHCQCKTKGFDYDHVCLFCEPGYTYAMTPDGLHTVCITYACIGFDNIECSGRGSCAYPATTCTCDETDKFTGASCAKCVNGNTATIDGRCDVSDACISKTLYVCNKHGNCKNTAGVDACECDAGYKGQKCEDCADNYTLVASGDCVPTTCVDVANYSNVPCHNHGTCDANTKKCVCDVGIAEGDFCETCKMGYAWNQHQVCTPIECLHEGAECSGNGYCTDSKCICDYKHTGDKCNECKSGFVLVNYSCIYHTCVSTVSGENAECGNHGECKFDHIDSSAKCECNAGYKGDQCRECDTDFVEIDGFCYHTNCVKNAVLCGNNGFCYAGDDGKYQCHCQDDVATGDDCTTCVSPYVSDKTGRCTHSECLSSDKLECAGRGACLSFSDTTNKCSCNDNFNPDTQCQTCLPGYELQDNICIQSSEACRRSPEDFELCSGHGTCTTSYLCHCNKQYKGQFCDECVSGLYEKDKYGVCRLKCNADADCGLNQECNKDTKVCQCKDTIYDYDQDCIMCRTGTSMAIFDGKIGCFADSCVDHHRVCNDAGNCINLGIMSLCSCSNAFYTGEFCEGCAEDAVRLDNGVCTAQACINSVTKTSCSNHGECQRSELAGPYCVCAPGYTGDHCENCLEGWIKFDNECRNTACIGSNNLECSGNGDCIQKDGVWSCQCNSYSVTARCMRCDEDVAHAYNGICYPLSCFNSEHSYCSAAGTCIRNDKVAQCHCDDYGRDPLTACETCRAGYTLVEGQCIDNYCMSADNKVCSGFGTCIEINKLQDWYECECNKGYIGASCDSCDTAEGYIRVGKQCTKPDCAYNDTVCSGNGVCMFQFDHSYKCQCLNGSSGTHCEICTDGYLQAKDGKCVPESCYVDGTECNNLGKCIALQFTHQCICDDIHLTYGSKCSQCEFGYQWLDGECHDENLGCADGNGLICGGHGICAHGVCLCHSRYTGYFCADCQSDATKLDTHCYRACSSNSDCGGTFQTCQSGVCKCVGEHLDIDQECNYCVPGRQMVAATNKCEPTECVTLQGELCNDAGECVYAEDLYIYECSCDDQRIADGNKCEICGSFARETIDGKCSPKECFSDNLKCHNHGSCEVDSNGAYACVCKPGYTGTYCKACAPGYKEDSLHGECVSEMCARRGGEVCTGNGRCIQKVAGDDQSWECYCYSASGRYCDECLDGTTKIGDKCVPASCVADGLECSDYGQCLLLGDTARCYCDGNRNSATACQTCADGYKMFANECYPLDCFATNGWFCNGTGHCIALGEHENIHVCQCNPGYAGATCERCETGRERIGRLCVRPECKTNNTNECNGNGECENLDGTWKCSCIFSSGEFCDTCLGGYTKLSNGKCVSESCVFDGKECNNLGVCQIHGFSQVCYCIDQEMDAEKQCGACLHGKVLIDGKCQTKPENKGLPVGAIVGIAIGAVAVVALIAVGVWFFMKRRGQTKPSSLMAPANDQVGQGEPQTYI